MKRIKRTLIILLTLSTACPVYACRFWVATGSGVAQDSKDQLLVQPYSLKNLGEQYQDGWSVGYYDRGMPTLWRSALASNTDAKFDKAVVRLSESESNILFSHLRRASSGCIIGVPNPHPFQRVIDGKTWLFGHNGGMKKQILIDLMGDEYLKANPPEVCTEAPPETWIDSELYFIYLMKSIEDHSWNVERGLSHGLMMLYQEIPEEDRYLNFFLSDGQTVWTYRKGTSLYYLFDQATRKSFVSSTIPDVAGTGWQEVPEQTLLTLSPNREIQFEEITDVSID